MNYWMLKEHQGNLNTHWLLRFHWFFSLVNLMVSSLSVHQVPYYWIASALLYHFSSSGHSVSLIASSVFGGLRFASCACFILNDQGILFVSLSCLYADTLWQHLTWCLHFSFPDLSFCMVQTSSLCLYLASVTVVYLVFGVILLLYPSFYLKTLWNLMQLNEILESAYWGSFYF